MEGVFLGNESAADIENGFFLHVHQGAEFRRGQAGGRSDASRI